MSTEEIKEIAEPTPQVSAELRERVRELAGSPSITDVSSIMQVIEHVPTFEKSAGILFAVYHAARAGRGVMCRDIIEKAMHVRSILDDEELDKISPSHGTEYQASVRANPSLGIFGFLAKITNFALLAQIANGAARSGNLAMLKEVARKINFTDCTQREINELFSMPRTVCIYKAARGNHYEIIDMIMQDIKGPRTFPFRSPVRDQWFGVVRGAARGSHTSLFLLARAEINAISPITYEEVIDVLPFAVRGGCKRIIRALLMNLAGCESAGIWEKIMTMGLDSEMCAYALHWSRAK